MSTRRKNRRHGTPEVVLGGLLWLMLLVALTAAYSLPELGSHWPSWMWSNQ